MRQDLLRQGPGSLEPEVAADLGAAMVVGGLPAVASDMLRHALRPGRGEKHHFARGAELFGSRGVVGVDDENHVLAGVFLDEAANVGQLRPEAQQRPRRVGEEVEALVQAVARAELEGHAKRVAKAFERLEAGAGEAGRLAGRVDGRGDLPLRQDGVARGLAAKLPGGLGHEPVQLLGGRAETPGVGEALVFQAFEFQRLEAQAPDQLVAADGVFLGEVQQRAVVLVAVIALEAGLAEGGGEQVDPAGDGDGLPQLEAVVVHPVDGADKGRQGHGAVPQRHAVDGHGAQARATGRRPSARSRRRRCPDRCSGVPCHCPSVPVTVKGETSRMT